MYFIARINEHTARSIQEKVMNESCDMPGMKVPGSRFPDPEHGLSEPVEAGEQRVVLGGGCFWCVEAVYLAVDGVAAVTSGYAGGAAETADYRSVCTGRSGHAEVIEVRYDPAKTGFGELLKIFFSVAHDPTQVNRQGNDRGTQYRSVVFYETEEQRQVAEDYIRQIDAEGVYGDPVATTLEPLPEFYPAEDYHQNFAARNPSQPYVQAVAEPKLAKLRSQFGDRVK
jgi:peptide-methionine (S)-S-oxide reductase